jgi:hypothetical protein
MDGFRLSESLDRLWNTGVTIRTARKSDAMPELLDYLFGGWWSGYGAY